MNLVHHIESRLDECLVSSHKYEPSAIVFKDAWQPISKFLSEIHMDVPALIHVFFFEVHWNPAQLQYPQFMCVFQF